MCGLPACGPGYGHHFGYGAGAAGGYSDWGTGFRGYGHLQGYGAGLHPGYDGFAGGCNYVRMVPYPVYYPVRHYVIRERVESLPPVRGKG
ncbi:hypothetical protein CEB3_c00710 [Peptococcaceae bacterium CEB3]|nr:hypothetical protein CEB3_c00710 [Peptococcaceae bacterium CEB3]